MQNQRLRKSKLIARLLEKLYASPNELEIEELKALDSSESSTIPSSPDRVPKPSGQPNQATRNKDQDRD